MPASIHLLPPAHSVLSLALFGCALLTLADQTRAKEIPSATASASASAISLWRLPAGPLAPSLHQWSQQSGQTLIFTPEQVEPLTASAVQGRYSAEDALQALLQGSGLGAHKTASGWRLERQLQPVVVRSTQLAEEDAPYLAPGSTAVITRAQIERFRGTSVGDIFQGTPGVLIGENRNSGGLDVNIRGMQGQSRVPVLVLVDGVRQEMTIGRGYAGAASRSYLDPDLLGGLQIDKGPTLNPLATGATGGLVSARTLNADDLLRPGQRFGLRLRGTAIGNNSGSPPPAGTPSGYRPELGDNRFRMDCQRGLEALCASPYSLDDLAGSQGMHRPATLLPRSWAGSLAWAGRWEALDLVAAYAQRQQGNYYAGTRGETPQLVLGRQLRRGFYTDVDARLEGASRFRGGERIANTQAENRSSLLKARLHLPQEQQLEMSWMRYRSRYGELMPSQLVGLGEIAQTEGSRVIVDSYSGQYRWQPDDRRWLDLSAGLWLSQASSANIGYAANSQLQGSGLLAGLLQDQGRPQRYRRSGLDLHNRSRLGAGDGLALHYGLSLQRERLTRDPGPESRTPALFRTPPTIGQRREQSAFVHLHWAPWPSLQLDAGLRHSRFAARDALPSIRLIETRTPLPNGGYGYSSSCERDAAGNCQLFHNRSRHGGSAPIASLTWQFQPGWQLYGRYAQALRMPSLFESNHNLVTAAQDVFLRPERSTNREIGISWLHNGLLHSSDKLRLRLAYFRHQTADYLTRTTNNLWEANRGLTAWSIRNIDRLRLNGWELQGSYDAGAYFLHWGGNRYQRIETCHTGSYRRQPCTNYGIAESYVTNMIPPNWQASATLGLRLLERRLELGLRGTWMGARNRQPEFNDQVGRSLLRPVPWSRYTLFDLFASYRVNDRLALDFNLDNLGDRYYLDALSLGRVPAPGRTARLSLTLQF